MSKISQLSALSPINYFAKESCRGVTKKKIYIKYLIHLFLGAHISATYL